MSVTAAEGFVASGCHARIKRRKLDMAMIATDDRQPVPCAAVFTTNKFTAPPVDYDRAILRLNGGRAAAVIVNSGNANAGTGATGLADAKAMCAETALALKVDVGDVLACSTGIIGTPLPMGRILGATPGLARSLAIDGAAAAALGILTTDTKPKTVVVRGSSFTLGGMAKGCGMIAPNMGTMLAFLTTDAALPVGALQAMLRRVAGDTFNALNVDGATSTNDTALLLASGRRGAPEPDEFERCLGAACHDLTMQMARDAEGMTKVVRLTVTGAASIAEATLAAKAIAENNLVKCSWNGGDPYWGRILAAAGSCWVEMNVARSSVSYGGITVARGGVGIGHDGIALTDHMLGDEIAIAVDLGSGGHRASVIGIDLGPGYIKENCQTS